MSAQEARGTGWSAYLDRFAADMLADALSAASGDYWRRRAEAWEAAKPKHGDYLGQATREDLSRAWRRCDERARACRARAVICDPEEWRELVDGEVPATSLRQDRSDRMERRKSGADVAEVWGAA